MWGERDRLLHISSSKVWTKGLPGAELISYPALGHMPMLEDPSRSASDILAFIAKHQ
jgi:pimeloyl-ACP methyl ester carboxylesterase